MLFYTCTFVLYFHMYWTNFICNLKFFICIVIFFLICIVYVWKSDNNKLSTIWKNKQKLICIVCFLYLYCSHILYIHILVHYEASYWLYIILTSIGAGWFARCFGDLQLVVFLCYFYQEINYDHGPNILNGVNHSETWSLPNSIKDNTIMYLAH